MIAAPRDDLGVAGGDAPAFRAVLDRIATVARSRIRVVFTGPTGVGKTYLARELHRLSLRRGRFVTVDCPAIQPTLFDRELFGHERGAFTGADRRSPGRIAAAEGGTLFLEEVGDLSPENQARLLSFLGSSRYTPVGSTEEHTADVRVVAATNRDVLTVFRADFRRRIAEEVIAIPSLDERPEDIRPLAEHECLRWAREEGWRWRPLSSAAHTALLARSWPDNVAGLSTAVHKALLRAHGEGASELEPRHFELEAPELPRIYDAKVSEFERIVLRDALDLSKTVTEAAQRLGIPRQRIHRKLRALNLEREQ